MNEAAYDILQIMLWGFVSTGAMSAIMFGSQSLGLSRLSFPFLIGTLFTGERRAAYIAGIIFYFLGGWLFAFIYYFVFTSLHEATWWFGALLGALHALIILVMLMPLLPHMHPRMASEYDGPNEIRVLEPPGFLALHYGYRTPLIMIVAQAVYGAILGALLPV